MYKYAVPARESRGSLREGESIAPNRYSAAIHMLRNMAYKNVDRMAAQPIRVSPRFAENGPQKKCRSDQIGFCFNECGCPLSGRTKL